MEELGLKTWQFMKISQNMMKSWSISHTDIIHTHTHKCKNPLITYRYSYNTFIYFFFNIKACMFYTTGISSTYEPVFCVWHQGHDDFGTKSI